MPGVRVDDADSAEDEVKVFTAEQDTEQASATLDDDKHEVTYQAECERPSTSSAAAANANGNGAGASSTAPSAARLPNGSIGSSTKGAFSKPSHRNGGGASSSSSASATAAAKAASEASAAALNGFYSHLQSSLNGAAPPGSPHHNANGNQFLFWAAAAQHPYGAFMGQQYSNPMALGGGAGGAHSPLFGGVPRGCFAPMNAQQATAALNALQLAEAAKTCSPTFVHHHHNNPYLSAAAAAGVSPSFDFNAALAYSNHLARFSPMLQGANSLSPSYGSPAANAQYLKHSAAAAAAAVNGHAAPTAEQLLAFKHSAAAAQLGASATVSLPSSFRMFNSTNPLASIASLRLPNMTQTVTNLANSLAASASSSSHHGGSHRSSNGAAHERQARSSGHHERQHHKKEETHIKKPLNAFMLFMKENRQRLMEEKGYKERQSAELNKELGRLWHTLTHQEQQKYYDMARTARKEHQEKYPGWSARDNYAVNKKKKRKRDKSLDNSEMKKCRARFGLNQTDKWCKHCKRKKKCLWFREGNCGGGGGGATSLSGVDSAEELSPACAQVSSTTHHGSSSPDNATQHNFHHHLLLAPQATATAVPMSLGGEAPVSLKLTRLTNGGGDRRGSPPPVITSSSVKAEAKSTMADGDCDDDEESSGDETDYDGDEESDDDDDGGDGDQVVNHTSRRRRRQLRQQQQNGLGAADEHRRMEHDGHRGHKLSSTTTPLGGRDENDNEQHERRRQQLLLKNKVAEVDSKTAPASANRMLLANVTAVGGGL